MGSCIEAMESIANAIKDFEVYIKEHQGEVAHYQTKTKKERKPAFFFL